MVAASLILSGCGGATTTPIVPGNTQQVPQPSQTAVPEKKVATLIFTQEFDNLAPLYSSMWFVWTTWQMFDHWAWEFDVNNEPFPRLVTEIPSKDNGGVSEDGTVITMHLRDDIKWSDNVAMTAEDFIFTWQMAISPQNTVATHIPV